MQTYPTGVAAKATGTPLTTLQRYLQRSHITLQPCDVPSRGCGENRGYSQRRIIQIALTTELARLGIGPSRAAKAAFEFSDKGNTGRPVGELYPLGQTLLVGLPDGKSVVINIPPDKSISDVLSNDSAAFICDCGYVVAKVLSNLSKS
ncbi:hypothetical protein G6321_00019000 [Bradyrhizobium barranii subsp. barranii]|uniref:HTH merR-type domain-containing protein n=1 Tax=Bradyrhizobium barranii subsp. barranii TaxID=2823807 RepID=A0A7Z0TXQ6_9BRAD|nr:hypothetical protein [Bradyrhizobium barranii]UGX97103.1 hypothetical protein G6321_00019000 [Bradyrhizobium barranii subsp. barranii]